MKNLKTLNEVVILNRSQQKRIFGGGEQTLGLDGETKCFDPRCAGQDSGATCRVGPSEGVCEYGDCGDGSIILLCYPI